MKYSPPRIAKYRLAAPAAALLLTALTIVSSPARADTAVMPDCPPANSDSEPAADMPMPMPDMKMKDPMPTAMAKDSMTMGDVTKMAMQRKACMDKMLEQEQQKLAPAPTN